MLFNNMFCSCWIAIQWLQNYLIPCPLKKLTGIDCPFCGFQRSVIALLQGNLAQSLRLYPGAVPVIFIALLSILSLRLKNVNSLNYLKKSLYLFTGIIIFGSYLIKISHRF